MDPEEKFSDAKMALEKVLEAVRIGDDEDLIKYLSVIDLVYIPATDQANLLDVILHYIYEYNQGYMVDIIFDYFDSVNGITTSIPTLSLFLMRNGIEDNILFYIGSNTISTFELVIQGINDSPISPSTYEGCVNAEKVFGIPNTEILLRLETYLFADPKDLNKYIYQYIKDKIVNVQPPKPKPEWIINGAIDDKIPFQSELEIPNFPEVSIMSPGELSTAYIKKSSDQGVKSFEEDDNFGYYMIASHYAISNLEQKLILVHNYGQNVLNKQSPSEYQPEEITADTRNDDVLFMIFGPTNTSYDQKVEPDPSGTNCERYGGCRMLICGCAEGENHDDADVYEYEDGAPQFEWFTGKCQQCDICIEYKHYALRKPLKLGGWVGCFCSSKCIQESINDASDLITPTLIERLTDALDKLGIQDRRYKGSSQFINVD